MNDTMDSAKLTPAMMLPTLLMRAQIEGIDAHYSEASSGQRALLALVLACPATGQWALSALARRKGSVDLDAVLSQLEGSFELPAEIEAA